MTTPNPNAATSSPASQESTSKPLGATPPAAAATPPPTMPPAATGDNKDPAATPPKTETPPQRRGALVSVASAEDVDRLLADNSNESNAIMPKSAIKKIKDKFEERGKSAGQAELQKQLEAQGFKTLDEALLAAAAARRQTTEDPSKKPDDANKDGKDKKRASFLPPRGKEAPQQTEMERKAHEARQEANREKRKREELEAQLESERAEFGMKQECLSAEVKADDLDYVMDRLRRHIGGLDDTALESFNTQKWLNDLKSERPYLFKGQKEPATTGVSSPNNVPPAPKPKDVVAETGDANKIDVRKMTKQQFEEHKKKIGYTKSYG